MGEVGLLFEVGCAKVAVGGGAGEGGEAKGTCKSDSSLSALLGVEGLSSDLHSVLDPKILR